MKGLYRLLMIATLACLSLPLSGQGHRIDIRIDGFQGDYLLLAQYYGEKPFIKDTIRCNESGALVIAGEQPLDEGMYFGVLPPDKRFFRFLVGADQQFTISSRIDHLGDSLQITGSSDNKLFSDYMDFIAQKQAERKSIQALEDSGEVEEEKVKEALRVVNKEINEYRKTVADANPGTVTAMLLRSDLDPEYPEFEGTEEEVGIKKLNYFKAHYFDHVDLSDPRTLRSPVLHNKVNFYIEKLTPQTTDSLKVAIDKVLALARPTPENFKYILITRLNEYAHSNVLDMDALFVYLADTYCAGEVDFLSPEELKDIRQKANQMRPVLIGNTASDITLFREDGSPLSLSDVEAEYTVLVFWRPGCSTCQKATPDLIRFADDYRDKGIKVLSICVDLGEKAAGCWDYVKEKGFDDHFFANLNDPKHSSAFYHKYNIRNTPRILVLDQDKKILVNRIGASQLAEVVDNFLKEEEG